MTCEATQISMYPARLTTESREIIQLWAESFFHRAPRFFYWLIGVMNDEHCRKSLGGMEEATRPALPLHEWPRHTVAATLLVLNEITFPEHPSAQQFIESARKSVVAYCAMLIASLPERK